tara:strand:+ start:3511 stop:4176 length:666 start_codon:yes stop_codon:yes gene_type:complete
MIHFKDLQEGLYDPNIFKAFFLAGGPGSGKSYVVRRTTGGLGLKVVDSDPTFTKMLKDANLSLKMPASEKEPRDIQRQRAKELTKKQQQNFIMGRLGLIIDGTGKDYEKITYQARELEQLGYDTYMIFVNTSLDVALERNAKRDRSVPESMVIKLWNQVQSNIGKFNLFFKQGFIIVDNNDAKQDILDLVYKRVKQLLRVPIRNTRAKEWMRMELLKKQQR